MHPSRLIMLAFGSVVAVGTGLLASPLSSSSGKASSFADALFTAVSAVTVTGLTTVDTQFHWNTFGHVVIALLIQVGGFGIVGFATLIGFLLDGRVSVTSRLTTSTESALNLSPNIKTLLMNIVKMMAFFQGLLFIGLFVRFLTHYDYDLQTALAHGIFHAISAFNNAGFALYSDSLVGFARDGWIIVPVLTAAFMGSLGFPVLSELKERLRNQIARWRKRELPYLLPTQWSLNSRIILWASFVLVVGGAIYVGLLEWNNPATLGPLDPLSKIFDAVFASVMPRTAGFNAMDISALHPSTWLGMDTLMFIGGGSASTAGGIKIGTAIILFYIIYTEIRGETAVNIGNRRLPRSIQRQALTIISLTSLAVLSATIILRLTTDFTLDRILFEVISATCTVGLSTGITAELPDSGKIMLAVLMFIGRLGPVSVATALALRKTRRHFEYPRERPLIG
ncbi:MAG: TrkH family potassium uptake protein [Aquiluna sp.]|nr:TrkH family potassium uptake protein [Aquiluna sp.]MCF8545979.1 TrkH family potassium uptake protein [Aquiluna sp.]